MFFGKDPQYQILDKEADETLLVKEERDSAADAFWRRAFFTLLIGSMFMATLVGIVSSVTFLRSGPQRHDVGNELKGPYSPVLGNIGYKSRWLHPDPRFVGSPSPEIDRAWEQLLRGTLIRVSEDDLAAANTTSIALKDGGYASALGISHSMHCLKRIRMAVYRSHYYPGELNSIEIETHAAHCLEWLRQLLLCQPDLGLYSLVWSDPLNGEYGGRDAQPHMCVDYDALRDWMISREVSPHNFVKPQDESLEDHDLD